MINLHHHDRDIESPWLRARLAMLPPGAGILDVGCVDGWVLDEYPDAIGVDQRDPPPHLSPRVRLVDAEKTGLAGGAFDAVTCVSVLEHVGLGWYGDPVGDSGKPGRVVAEMARVLRPGGWLLLTVPIGLTMTKHGRPFARWISEGALARWLSDASMTVHEWLLVSSPTWSAAPDDDGHRRSVALIAASKGE